MIAKNIKSILVGVDFSNYSKIVVQEAQQLSRKLKAPLTYVHCYTYDRWPQNIKEDLIKSLPEQIRSTYHLDPKADVRIGFGEPAEAIISWAKKLKNPLIMIGHKGHSPVLRFFLGSTAEKIAQISKFPVWIHRGSQAHLPKKILVPSDLSQQTEKTLAQIQPLNKSLKTDIELYHVSQEPSPFLDYSTWNIVYSQMISEDEHKFSRFQKNHNQYKSRREVGNIAERIEKRSRKFDLVALAAHKSNKNHPTLGPIAAKLIRSGQKPVLICR